MTFSRIHNVLSITVLIIYRNVGSSNSISIGRLVYSLPTLETRRLRGDEIEVFIIVNGYEDVDRNVLFRLEEGSRTRGRKTTLVNLRNSVGWT